jgi:hypothetical protein
LTDTKPVSTDRWAEYADPLRLDQRRLEELVCLRTKGTGSTDAATRREWHRLRIPGHSWVPAEMKGLNGATARLKIYPVDISASGMCFIVGMYLHHGTECSLTLHLPDGEMMRVVGHSESCEFLKDRAHEVFLHFTQPLDMALLQMSDVGAALVPGPVPHLGHAADRHSIGATHDSGVLPDQMADRAALVEIKALKDELRVSFEKFASRVDALTSNAADADRSAVDSSAPQSMIRAAG